MKEKHGKIKFNNKLEMIYWHGYKELEALQFTDDSQISAICRFQINEFRGKKTAQFIVNELQF